MRTIFSLPAHPFLSWMREQKRNRKSKTEIESRCIWSTVEHDAAIELCVCLQNITSRNEKLIHLNLMVLNGDKCFLNIVLVLRENSVCLLVFHFGPSQYFVFIFSFSNTIFRRTIYCPTGKKIKKYKYKPARRWWATRMMPLSL